MVSTRGAAVPARSHTRTVPSSPPLTAVRPSALTATASHRAVVAGEHPRRGGQVPHPHRAVVAAADRGPPVRADRHRAPPSWPVSTRGAAVPARSHTRTVPSRPPLTAVRPSALTATAFTRPLWPVSSRGAAVPARSHTRTVPSPPPLTAVRPSALTATPLT